MSCWRIVVFSGADAVSCVRARGGVLLGVVENVNRRRYVSEICISCGCVVLLLGRGWAFFASPCPDSMRFVQMLFYLSSTELLTTRQERTLMRAAR